MTASTTLTHELAKGIGAHKFGRTHMVVGELATRRSGVRKKGSQRKRITETAESSAVSVTIHTHPMLHPISWGVCPTHGTH